MAKPNFNEEDDELLEALGVDVEVKKKATLTPREERILAGFEEVQRFVDTAGHLPRAAEDCDIFERLYATRLERIRHLDNDHPLLLPHDRHGLLADSDEEVSDSEESDIDDDELLKQLGVGADDADDLTNLQHVRSSVEKRAAEEIAQRSPCQDFDSFKPLFKRAEEQLRSGERETRAFETRTLDGIRQGAFFIVSGQIAYIAEVGEDFQTKYDRRDSRLRVVYDNGTESDVLQRSLQRALHRDETARLLTDPVAGPLFGDTIAEDDVSNGTIYVLRSHSSHPFVAEHRELVHKIGLTAGKVESRIANAFKNTTYLLADVEVVATYKLVSISPAKLENILHRVFAPAQIDLQINDRFGHPVRPREWFLVPLHVIDQAVRCIRDGSITQLLYDPKEARLVHRKAML